MPFGTIKKAFEPAESWRPARPKARPRVDECPLVDIGRLRKDWEAGQPLLLIWRVADRRIGHAHLRFDEDERLVINWRVLGSPTHHRRGGETRLRLRWHLGRPGAERCLLACPTCDAKVQCVYYLDAGWRCRKCSGLGYASQVQSPIDRKIEKLKDLVRQGAAGPRPKGMWASTHAKLRAEYLALEGELGSPELLEGRALTPSVQTELADPADYPGLRPSVEGDTGCEALGPGEDSGFDFIYEPRLPGGGPVAAQSRMAAGRGSGGGLP